MPGASHTHRDHHRVLRLELGHVLVASYHLGVVQRPEAAHYFDAALCRVGHLVRFLLRLTPGACVRQEKIVGRGPGDEQKTVNKLEPRGPPLSRPGPCATKLSGRRNEAHFPSNMAAMAEAGGDAPLLLLSCRRLTGDDVMFAHTGIA